MESQEHFDILIIGAGISGIDAAYHLQTTFPGKTYAILEARDAIGGHVGSLPLSGRAVRF
jgi:monooxygenase